PATAVLEHRVAERQFARGRFFSAGAAHSAVETASVEPQQPAFAKLRERAFIRNARIAQVLVAAATTTPETPAEAAPEPIMIFGLICSRLPRSPNPDPTLFA
ncbi:MAG: hypothetical protein M3Q19_07670, partial [Pseudomonadota bacterium]|nr:hypothetical protein [Pseudomonadota bacterium]